MKDFLFKVCLLSLVMVIAWIVCYERIQATPSRPTYTAIAFDEKKMADSSWLERQGIGLAIALADWKVTDYGVCRTALLRDSGGDIQLWQEPLTCKWRRF